MDVDTSKWSGEGEFTQVLIDHLRRVPNVAFVRVEDAPASRSEADYNFISNEVFVDFAVEARSERTRKWGIVPVSRTREIKTMNIEQLEAALTADPEVGAPDYSDDRYAAVPAIRTNHAAVSDARIQDGGAGADLRNRHRAASFMSLVPSLLRVIVLLDGA